jgi:hypothetical protein
MGPACPSLLRLRVEIMGPRKYEDVGKSQSVLIMINPIIFTRTRSTAVPMLTEISLCHACSWQATEDGNARAGHVARQGTQRLPVIRCTMPALACARARVSTANGLAPFVLFILFDFLPSLATTCHPNGPAVRARLEMARLRLMRAA